MKIGQNGFFKDWAKTQLKSEIWLKPFFKHLSFISLLYFKILPKVVPSTSQEQQQFLRVERGVWIISVQSVTTELKEIQI